MYGLSAADYERSGYHDINEIAARLGKIKERRYVPVKKSENAYDRLYSEYQLLYDYFGKGRNNVMKHLKTPDIEDVFKITE